MVKKVESVAVKSPVAAKAKPATAAKATPSKAVGKNKAVPKNGAQTKKASKPRKPFVRKPGFHKKSDSHKKVGAFKKGYNKATKKEDKNDVKKDVKHFTEFTKDDIDRVQVIKDQSCSALAAMRKYLAQAGGKSLFPDIDHALQLMFVYKKPSMYTCQSRQKIVLPAHHRNLSNTTVCLIMPDLDKSEEAKKDHDVDKQSRQWAEKIEEEHGITKTQVARIMTYTELKRTAYTFADIRALASSYDLFLVDARVGKAVCNLVGKEFQRTNKKPFFIDYGKPLATSIDTLIRTVVYRLDKFMTRVAVNVGHLGQESTEILANIATVLDEGLKVAPGGLRNIRGIHLQSAKSKPSLPIFSDDGSYSDIHLKVEKPSDRVENQKISGDCSTLPSGLKVEVRRNGKIRVLKEDDNSEVLYPTIHDEWDENDLPNTKPSVDPSKLKAIRHKKRKLYEARMAETAKFKQAKKEKLAQKE